MAQPAAPRPHPRRARPGPGPAVALAAAAAALAGCSAGSGPAANPVAAVQQAALTSAAAGSAKVSTDVTMTVGGRSTRFVGTGLFDLAGQIGSITVQKSGPGGAPAGPDLDEVVTPASLYLRDDATGAKWGEVAAARLADGDLISAGYTNPVLAFALLRGAGGKAGPVAYAGRDTIRGVAVSHYTGRLDLGASADAAAGPVKADLGAAASAFSQRIVPFDVYLDAQGRVCRVITHYSFPASAPQKGQVQVDSTTDLYDFGTPATVQTPGPAELATAAPSTTASAAG
ncbi:MAG TPA: hypothetical protein VGX23_37180 [Actinocrinis sp.]|nr:hypothetical protein [Actinocrinis sp.]